MKLLKIIALFLMLISVPSPANAGELKIGYVDLQEALAESNAGKKARELFQKEVDRLQKDLDQHQAELKKMKDELEKGAFLLSEETKEKKEKEYKEKIKEFQRFYQDSRNKLKEKDAQLTKKLIDELKTVIEKIAREGGYAIIFQNSEGSILFADKSIDLTKEMIKKSNNKAK